MKQKEFNLYKYLNVNDRRVVARGVFFTEYKNQKYHLATNGKFLIGIKKDYTDNLKGKIVDKYNDTIDSDFPNFAALISSVEEDKRQIDFSLSKTKEHLKQIKPFESILKKLPSKHKSFFEEDFYALFNFEDVRITIAHVKILTDFIESFPNCKVYLSKSVLYATDEDNFILIQGYNEEVEFQDATIERVIDGTICLMQSSYRKITDYSYKEYLKICKKQHTDLQFKQNLRNMFAWMGQALKED